MNFLVNALTKMGISRKRSRLSCAACIACDHIPLFFGYQKWFNDEAQALIDQRTVSTGCDRASEYVLAYSNPSPRIAIE
jgi:hypothetical protein